MLTKNGSGVLSCGAFGAGDVVGPSGATANALARYDLAIGKLIKDNTATLSDAGAVAGAASIALKNGSNSVTLAPASGTTASRSPFRAHRPLAPGSHKSCKSLKSCYTRRYEACGTRFSQTRETCPAGIECTDSGRTSGCLSSGLRAGLQVSMPTQTLMMSSLDSQSGSAMMTMVAMVAQMMLR
jgi:hypothetical protein